MEVSAISEEQRCPCYATAQRQQFLKLVELKDFDLVVYCHRTCTDKIRPSEAVDALNISRDVFILHNKKDVKIKTTQLTMELEQKNISCPRCRKRFKHAQELIKEVKSLDKKIVMGICDHCRKRTVVSNKKPFCVCQRIVKLFKTVKDEQIVDTKKQFKVMLSKEGHLLKDKRKDILPYSNLQIYQDINIPAKTHEPEVQQMFYSDPQFVSDVTEISKTDSKDVCIKQAVAFTDPVRPMKTSLVHTTQEIKNKNSQDPDMWLVDSGTTFVETDVGVKNIPRSSIKNLKQEEIFEDTPSIDAKEELKRRHDISLRQMFKLEKDFRVRKITNVHETPKITQIANRFSTDIKLVNSNVKEAKSEKYVAKSKSLPNASIQNVSKPQFSFIFPKEKKKEKQINIDVDSSQLIKATQEKFRLESERKEEEKRQRKQEQKQKKILAREEKKRQAEEKKRLADAEKKLADEAKRLADNEKKLVHEAKRLAEDEENLADDEERLADEAKRLSDDEKKIIEKEQQSLVKIDKSREINLGKDQKSDVIQDKKLKYKKSDVVQDKKSDVGKDSVKDKSNFKIEDQSKSDVKGERLGTHRRISELMSIFEDKDVEKDTTFKMEEVEIETQEEEEIETQKEEKLKTENDDRLKTKKKTKIEKLLSDKQGKILRDKNQQQEIKNNLKVEKSLRKKKVLSSRPTSIVDESTNKENIEMPVKKRRSKLLTDKELKEKEEFKKAYAIYLTEKALKIKQKLELEAQKEIQEAKRKAIEELKKSRKNKAGSKKKSKLVKIKKDNIERNRLDIDPELLKSHNQYHTKSGQKTSACPVCVDSELELELLSLENKRKLKNEKIKDIIIGEQIYKNRPRLEKIKKTKGVPLFFHKDLESDHQLKLLASASAQAETTKPLEMEPIGVVRYALSDRTFIDKGWTLLPTEKVLRKMNVYRMRPAHPEFDWFKHNKNKRLMTYDTGERLAEFDDNGRGRWYYRNGRLALDYYDAEEANAQQRFVVYSSGEPDERGRKHPITILATFDYLGNGIVLDHAGNTRLKYNQTEGVVLDPSIGPVSHWKWHSLNDPPVLQQVMIDNHMAHKDPDILKLGSPPPPPDNTNRRDSEEMLAIEFDNFVREKRKKLCQKFKPFHIKMKAFKINQYFSLKVLDQATVHLIFRDGLTNLRVNMGMKLDDTEIVDTETSEVGEVSTSLSRFPARTDSLAGLQRRVVDAQSYARQQAERERRLLRPVPCASADLMTAATSPPMQSPLRTLPYGSSYTTECTSSKPSNNLYCDSRRTY